MSSPVVPPRVGRKEPQAYKRGMEFLNEDVDYSVAEFYEQFNNSLPKTVMVSEGFCGEIIEDIFDRGQVLRLYAISKQRRVVARFQYLGASRLISIPDSYNEKLCVVKRGKCGKPKDIYAILADNPLPLTVQFPKDQTITVGNQAVSSNNIPSLELTQTFDEVYILGNFLSNGTLIQDVVPVPLYLSHLRLSLVTGVKGQSSEKWKDWEEELDREASYIEYDQQFGNPHIAEYDPSAIHSDVTYTYVEPRLYSNIFKLVQKPPSRSFENVTYSAEELHTYEDDPNCYDEIDKPTDKSSNDNSPTRQEETGDRQSYKHELEQALKCKGSKSSESEDGKTMLSFKPHVNKTSSPPKTMPKPSIKHKALPPTPEIVTQPCPAPTIPQRKPVTVGPQNTKAHNVTAAIYSNDIPRSKIQPTMQVDQSSPNTIQTNAEKEVPESNIPENISNLTIDEVAVYMKKLKLEKYVPKFKEQLIDGRMLLDLDKDILKEEFGLTVIEAIRLINFARDGHVPK